jgi:hypothetical protein
MGTRNEARGGRRESRYVNVLGEKTWGNRDRVGFGPFAIVRVNGLIISKYQIKH